MLNNIVNVLAVKFDIENNLIAVRTLEEGVLSWPELRSQILLFDKHFSIVINGEKHAFQINEETLELDKPDFELLSKAEIF
ncbi:hypothetical protein [Mycoplasma todarodis]|uniref:Uncharacterized protein n=1 Tax=Mycoplasma todarodis TaxID=1937191 RepID=A0A4R0XR66_9MOLU|nr:hypothetical protein [Mycoplasma todarodis]TCG12100.1 hypothetical protein C4B25_00195 [Mycoplasma todarodis]